MTEETDYEKIFRHRGASYHKAMVDFPGVRSQEFQNLFRNYPLRENELIIDCPALGGYLQDNLTVPVRVESLDFCPQGEEVKFIKDLDLLEKADRVVCLASSHHINNLGSFVSQLTSFLKPGGLFHLADVGHDSLIRYFLDDFVGKWTSTGHSGIWRSLSKDYLSNLGEGLVPTAIGERSCPWRFQNQEQMLIFCRLLFGLDLNPSDRQIMQALSQYVGFSSYEKGFTIMWKLTHVDFIKR